MYGKKKLINIWLAFRILELETNFGDFICVTFCVGIVEILNLQFRYKFG